MVSALARRSKGGGRKSSEKIGRKSDEPKAFCLPLPSSSLLDEIEAWRSSDSTQAEASRAAITNSLPPANIGG